MKVRVSGQQLAYIRPLLTGYVKVHWSGYRIALISRATKDHPVLTDNGVIIFWC